MDCRKKILYYLLTGLTTTSLTLSACSCELFGSEEPHQHAWSEWQTTTNATCNSKGEKRRTCECGEVETQEIAQTAHKAGSPKIEQEASCTESGLSVTYCVNCNEKLNESPIATKGHSYVDVEASKGDCYTEGYTAHKKCSVCDDTQGKESTGHYHEVSITTTLEAATDHKDGKAYVKCYECGYDGRTVKDENGDPAPEYLILPMKHTLEVRTTVEATCYSDGETQVFCLDCEEWLNGTEEIVSKETVAHKFTVSVAAKNETCYEAGYTAHHVCSVCGEKDTDYSIVTPTHVFDEAGKCTRKQCGVETFDYEIVYNESNVAIGYSIAKFHVLENDTRDNIIIPEKYAYGTEGQTLPVISIAEEAFQNVSTITKITLPESITEIADSAFENCSNLTEINLQKVEKIGKSAFENCENLKTLAFEIPVESSAITISQKSPVAFESLLELGEAAFKGCSSLTSIKLNSATLTTIPDCAFENCSSLTEIYLGKQIASIGENVFKNCSAVEKITVPYIGLKADNKTTFSAIFGGDRELPSTLKEITVSTATKIADSSFKNVYAQVINLPATVTEIGEEAFAGCVSLTNVAFTGKSSKNDFSNIEKIGKNAFKNSGLTTVILPFLGETVDSKNGTLAYAFGENSNTVNVTLNAATKLYDNAFANAKNLAYVKIPAVTEIGNNAFGGCISLKTIQYAEEKEANVFPTTVTKIGLGAFTQVEISEITLPFVGEALNSENDWICYVFGEDSSAKNNSLNVIKHKILTKITILQATTVKVNSFAGCNYLTDVVLPCTVTAIEDGAFKNCQRLKNVTVLKDESDDEIAYLTTINESAFMNCSSLTSFIFDNRVLTTLKDSAFENCLSLSTFDFPEKGFSFLGNKAFAGCKALSSIELEAGLTAIGDYTFSDCSSLTSIEFNEDLQELGNYAFQNCTALNNVTMNDTLLTIGEFAFKNCSKLTKVSVPESVNTIGKGVFQACSKLNEMELPFVGNTVNHDVTNGSFTWFFDCSVNELPSRMKVTLLKATKLTNGAFTNYTGLTEIVLPSTLTKVDESAFENCSNLTKVTFQDGELNTWNLEKIGDMAFKNTALLEIALPVSVKMIGTESFSKNLKLTKVTLQEGLETINDMAFEDCSALSSIILPKSIKRLDGYVFRNCENLTNVVIPATIEHIGDGAFENCSKMQISKTEIVRKEIVLVPTSLVFEGNVEIGEYAFKNCANLTNEIIFKAPSTVGSNAFYGCTSVEYVFIQVSTYEEVSTEPEQTPVTADENTTDTEETPTEPAPIEPEKIRIESYFGARVFNSNETGKAMKIYVTENVDENKNWTDWKIGVNPETTVTVIESYEQYEKLTVAL